MGDDNTSGSFNPCECIWNHQLAMRRLLEALRNSQSVCTDTECFEPGLPDRTPSSENLYFMTFMIGIALLLFFLRPTFQRNRETLNKPSNDNNGNNTPPAPPVD